MTDEEKELIEGEQKLAKLSSKNDSDSQIEYDKLEKEVHQQA